MNETEAGASVTGWSRSDAPKTCPASICIRSSRLRSGSDDWAQTDGDTATMPRIASRQARPKTLIGCRRVSVRAFGRSRSFMGFRQNEQLRADLQPGALDGIELMLKRSCPCSKNNCAIPPTSLNPSMSLMVSTGASRSPPTSCAA